MDKNWTASVAPEKGMLSATEALLLIGRLVSNVNPHYSDDVDSLTMEKIDLVVRRWRAWQDACSEFEDPSIDPWEGDPVDEIGFHRRTALEEADKPIGLATFE